MTAETTEPIGLTPRELEVAVRLAIGHTSHEVAEQLAISSKTVDTHRNHVLKKLGLRNNVELTRYLLKAGWVTL